MIQHTFKTTSHNLLELFNGVNSMNSFKRNLEQQSDIDILRYDKNKYLGDGFEFFIELFLFLHPNDSRIGLGKYKPTQKNDNGVDGVARNNQNELSAVQIKYRTNPLYRLTANEDHLSNLFSDSAIRFGIVPDIQNQNNLRHFIFTTAAGLNHYTDNSMYQNKLKCFGISELKMFVDNNKLFWDNATDIASDLMKYK